MVYVVSALKKCLITISLVIVLLRFYPFVSSVNPIRPSLDTVFFFSGCETARPITGRRQNYHG